MTRKYYGGSAKPQVEEKVFIECWNRHGGNAELVAKELNMKYNSAWVRGTRLLKKHGIENPGIYKTFDLNFEKLESEKK